MLNGRREELDIRVREHDAVVTRADAVLTARREREAERAKISRRGIEIAYRDDCVINAP